MHPLPSMPIPYSWFVLWIFVLPANSSYSILPLPISYHFPPIHLSLFVVLYLVISMPSLLPSLTVHLISTLPLSLGYGLPWAILWILSDIGCWIKQTNFNSWCFAKLDIFLVRSYKYKNANFDRTMIYRSDNLADLGALHSRPEWVVWEDLLSNKGWLEIRHHTQICQQISI